MAVKLDVKGKGKATPAIKQVKKSKRPRAASTSSSGSSSENDGADDKAAMLAALEAHGRAMFGFSAPEDAESSEQGRRRLSEEMSGVQSDSSGDEGEEYESDDGWGEGDEMVTDSEDEEMSGSVITLAAPTVPEVVFAPTSYSKSDELSKGERRAFLKGNSAKIMGIKPSTDYGPPSKKRQREEAEEDLEDQSNLKLDKTLHNMLLTTLLPGAEAGTAQRPVDKRKAMSGRLLELAQFELPGEGTKSLSVSQHSGHSAKIKTGIMHAKASREKKARAEAEAAGSFVKGLGGLGGEGRGFKSDKGRGKRAGLGEDVRKKKGMDGRKGEKRERGLGSGFGRFEGGMLKLSASEIARGSGEGRGGGGRGGRGGKRGRGRR